MKMPPFLCTLFLCTSVFFAQSNLITDGTFDTNFNNNTDSNNKWQRSDSQLRWEWNSAGHATNTRGSAKGFLQQTITGVTEVGYYTIDFDLFLSSLSTSNQVSVTLGGSAVPRFLNGAITRTGFGTIGSVTSEQLQFEITNPGDVVIKFTKTKSAKVQSLDNVVVKTCPTCEGLPPVIASKIRLNLVDDPRTTIQIGWDTNQYDPATQSYDATDVHATVYYDTVDHGTDWESYAFSKTVDAQNDNLAMRNSFARLTGLTPNTAYYFVIKDDRGVHTRRLWFKTAPDTNIPMTFIAGGDSRGGSSTRLRAAKLISKLKPTAIFFGGDYTGNAGSQSEWTKWLNEWQNTISSDGRMYPIVIAEGNHDSTAWLNRLWNIGNAIYYKLQFGENLLSLYTLNTQIGYPNAQKNWLETTAANDNSIWKSAQYHKPIRPHVAHKGEGVQQYARWAPVFYNHNFQFVYESDSHTVKATWPIKPCSEGENCIEGYERDDETGTVFLGEGCWGAPIRDNNDDKVWTRDSGMFAQFKYVQYTETTATAKTIRINDAGANSPNENTNAGEYAIPAGVEVWNPANGDTITYTLGAPANQNPTVAITAPTDGQIFGNLDPITLTADATDTDGSVTSVGFYVDGALVATDTEAPYEYTYTPTGYATYLIDAVATDNESATTTSSISITVQDNNQAPTVAITAPVDGQSYTDLNAITVTADATDTDGTVTSVEFYIDGSLVATDTTAPYEYAFTPATYADYVIEVKATDDDAASSTNSIAISVLDTSGTATSVAASILEPLGDVEENTANGAMYTNSSGLDMVYEISKNRNMVVGLRYTGLNIPQGATILDAYIQFTSGAANAEATTLTFKAEDADNSQPFAGTNYNVSSRTLTTSSTDWTPNPWTNGASGADQKTPDLSNIIQEVVSRSSYTSSSAIAIVISGSGTRVAKSERKGSAKSPTLHVTYTTGAVSPVQQFDSFVENHNHVIEVENSTHVLPNPFVSSVKVVNKEVIKSIVITDLRGKFIKYLTPNATATQIELQDLNSGTYVLSMETISGSIVTKKIIKQ